MEPQNTLTVRELRHLLTAVDTQEMTVRQLRQALFYIDNQEAPATGPFLIQITAQGR